MQMMKIHLCLHAKIVKVEHNFANLMWKRKVQFLRLTVYTETDTAKNNFSFKK